MRTIRPASCPEDKKRLSAQVTPGVFDDLLNEREMRGLLDKESQSGGMYLGSLPLPFTPEDATLKHIDRLASRLQLFEMELYSRAGIHPEKPEMESFVQLGGLIVHVKYLGSGNFGSAFQLATPEKSFVLKTYYRRNYELLHSGPYSEAALGAFVTRRQVRDMPRMYIAHPAQGWLLTELVDSNWQPANPEGPSWKELSLRSLDPSGGLQNEIPLANGRTCRIDYGHLTAPYRKKNLDETSEAVKKEAFRILDGEYASFDNYCSLFEKYPEARHSLFASLKVLSPERRMEFLEYALNYDEVKYFPVHDFFLVKAFAPKDAIRMFTILMRHKDLVVRARSVFDTSSVAPFESRIMVRAWEEFPVFEPLRIYRSGGCRFKQFLETGFADDN